ncbi:S41 family peptidase [Pedobacter sp.]|uniref:S41 family peptidase n=1 Tax=Pedobacter sp. TaxID=1411316 RepID=UPI0031D2FE0F
MKNKYTIIAICMFAFVHYSAMAQIADSIRVHIDSCLSILQEHSLYVNSVNWDETRTKVFEKAKTAKTKVQTFEALKIAFDALGDKHAAYYHGDDSYKIDNSELIKRYSDSIKVAWTRGPRIDGRMIGDIAYFSVPFMGINKQEQIDWYANWLYDEVAKLQKHNPKGWVIDLRLNGGGNIRPMLTGLAMFFGDGIVSYYRDKNGKNSDEAAFSKGNFLMDGKLQAAIKNKITGMPYAKVAVIIGAGTASSGEITAAVFSQRHNTLLLGDSTAGLANATNGFVFNNNKTYFLISTACITDPHKIPFPQTIQPNLFIKGNDAFNDIGNDIAVNKAIEWLRQ